MVALVRERMAREHVAMDVVVGDGMALPWADGACDASFSMFGLMFFPDRGRGFRGLRRVLRAGGRAVVASWTPLDEVPFFKELFATLQAELPHLPLGASRMPLASADEMHDEMAGAGFQEIAVHRRQRDRLGTAERPAHPSTCATPPRARRRLRVRGEPGALEVGGELVVTRCVHRAPWGLRIEEA